MQWGGRRSDSGLVAALLGRKGRHHSCPGAARHAVESDGGRCIRSQHGRATLSQQDPTPSSLPRRPQPLRRRTITQALCATTHTPSRRSACTPRACMIRCPRTTTTHSCRTNMQDMLSTNSQALTWASRLCTTATIRIRTLTTISISRTILSMAGTSRSLICPCPCRAIRMARTVPECT